MKIPKALQKYADENGYTIQVITFRHMGAGVNIKRKGFSLMGGRTEFLEIEPKDYSNGDKWKLTGKLISDKGEVLTYAKNIVDAIKQIK